MGKLVDIDGLNRQTSLMKDWVKNASGKVNSPVDSSDGNGKFLKSNGDGTTSWVDAAQVPQADLAEAVDNYFTEHPGEKIGLDTGDVEWNHLNAAVQNKITSAHTNIATVEPTSTASIKHEKGSHFEYNNTLYEATTTIIVGETITPNVNCKVSVISDELTNLKEDIILAQQSQPMSEDNRIWIPTNETQEVEVPTFEEFEDLKSALPPINAQLQAEFNERNYETGHYAGAFQYGNLTIDGNALVYSKMTTRICSKLDCGIHAEAGEKIGLSDYTNAVYYTFCIKDSDKSAVYVSSWKSAEIIAPYDGSYFFIIRNATETEITDTASLAELLYVKRRNSLNSKIDGVYSFSSSDFAQGSYIPSSKSWGSGETKRITVLVNVKAGQILDVKPSEQNYIAVNLYDENGTALQSYDFNNYQMRIPVKNDGLLMIRVANNKSYNSATAIVPTDYTSEILLYSVSASSIRTVEHITKNDLFNGSYVITSDSFAPNDNRRICLVKYVPKGTVISVKSVNLFISIFKSVNKIGTTIKDCNKIPFNVTIDEDCIIYMVFGNGHSYNASTAITTNDYNSDIYFIYNEGKENKKAFKVMNPNIITVDHRGYITEAPENTLPALYLSKKHGFDWVEFDVQMTSDNIPVLLHDATIDRTSNGTGAIADMTYEQALQYGYGKGYVDYADVKIPTLEEACELCKRIALHPFIELKADVTWDASKVAIVMNAVAKMGMLDDSIFTSFSYTALDLVKTDYPKAKLVYTQNTYSTDGVQTAKALQNNDNTVYYSIGVHSALSNIDALAQSRLPIVAWTIEDVYGLVNLIPSVAKFIVTTDLNATGYLYNLENVKY